MGYAAPPAAVATISATLVTGGMYIADFADSQAIFVLGVQANRDFGGLQEKNSLRLRSYEQERVRAALGSAGEFALH